ncbi:MAG: molybdenum cofactor guanylyltransferase MobA [Arenicellales bacterium]
MNMAIQAIAAVILAGGKGRRMQGSDKGLLMLNGRTLIEAVLTGITPQVGHVLINANRNFKVYKAYGPPVINDQVSGFLGPLAGIHAAMLSLENHAHYTHLLSLPCDGPKVANNYASLMYAALLQNKIPNECIVVAHDGERIQPVHALIPLSLLTSLSTYLAEGGRKVDIWYQQHNMVLADFSGQKEMFMNVNTPEQLNTLS